MSSTPQSKESTASTDAVNATHPLKRKSDDIGWEFCIRADPLDPDKVQCLKCKKLLSGGVYRIKHHIAGIVGQVKPCPNSANEDRIKCRNALNDIKIRKQAKQDKVDTLRTEVNISNEGTIDLDEMEDSFGKLKPSKSCVPIDRFAKQVDNLSTTSKQANISTVIKKEQVIAMKEYICRWAYKCAIPFHAFEDDCFLQAMQAIGQFGPNGPSPTRYEMGETFLKKEVARTKGLVKKYEEEWESIGCSIMTDAWSDRKRRSIMNLCVNSKRGTVFMSAKDCSDEAHTSGNIFEYVDRCIEDVGAENVFQVVTDNASNNMGAAKLLHEKRPKIFWTSCATHTINLMLEGIGGIPRYTKTLDNAKTITVFIYAHHKTLAMMRHFTNFRDIVRPGVTRFASGFLTLQSLVEKKSDLRRMFCSEEWEKCKFFQTVKGKQVYALVLNASFWAGVTICLRVFSPLVKVLRMVDADWKPSMGFIYGELKRAKQEIKDALDNDNAYNPILTIIEKKAANRLDTGLHKMAYILNPYYYYHDPLAKKDVEASDSIVDILGILFPGDYEIQDHINTVELPKYKEKLEKFDRPIAIKSCEVNNDKFDPANWWESYGSSAPNLRKIATKILSLTTSSSGCERIWSVFEGVHTKKRNRLEVAKMNNLIYVQANAHLMERDQKRKVRNRETLIGEDACEAQDWIVDDAHWEAVGDALGVDDELRPRTSARKKVRQLFEDDFVSDSEEELDEEVEYESDGVQILEQYGQDQI